MCECGAQLRFFLENSTTVYFTTAFLVVHNVGYVVAIKANHLNNESTAGTDASRGGGTEAIRHEATYLSSAR